MNKIFLTKKISSRIAKGHDWIFDYEIAIREGECSPGAYVHVFTHTGSFLGIGIYGPQNKIAIRILSRKNEPIEFEGFFKKKLKDAIRWRESMKINSPIYRIFHSESDGISGLIIDKIEKNIFVQLLTYGLELRKEIIENVLYEVLGETVTLCFDLSNSLRKYENLEVKYDNFSPVLINEYDYKFPYKNKSSFSIERRDLYSFIGKISAGKTVWDIFCGAGHFGIQALKHNSRFVLFVDNQNENIDYIKSVIVLNSFENKQIQFLAENAFDVLRHKKRLFPTPDILILDFPKFSIKENNFNAYKELIMQSFKILSKDGLLFLGYQSSDILPTVFESVMEEASLDTKRNYLIIKRFHNSIDLPIHPVYEHSDNLHFWLLQIK